MVVILPNESAVCSGGNDGYHYITLLDRIFCKHVYAIETFKHTQIYSDDVPAEADSTVLE